MQLQHLNNQLMQQWFEDSCEMWVSHYSFLLNLPWNTEADKMWYKEQINMNKIYDV